MKSRVRLIRQLAAKYGIRDPEAVLAIASVEGRSALHGGRSVGDGGTSFGPFQLHRGGALPAGRGSAWAHSPAGIEYAIRKISETSARGKTGKAAVSAISAEFERPADIPGEIAKAMGYYGNVKGGGPGISAAPMPLGVQRGAGGVASGLSQDAFKSMVAASLLQSARARSMGMESPSSLLGLAMARRQMQAAQDTYGPEPGGPVVGGGSSPGPAPGGRISAGKDSLDELFYDPLGGIKYGKEIGAIGGHGTHVHLGEDDNPAAMMAAIRKAQKMGLRVSENPLVDKVDPVHTKHSYHYRTFGGKNKNLGTGLDVSGDSRKLAAYYRWAKNNLR